jgi:hypothetical protein
MTTRTHADQISLVIASRISVDMMHLRRKSLPQRQSGEVRASPLSPPLRTGHESFQLIRLKPYFKLENLDLECTCL